MESTRLINRLWQKSSRAIGVAALSCIAVGIVGYFDVANLRSYLVQNPQDAAEMAEAEPRIVTEWLYLSLASFAATLACATGFEYAYFTKKRWLSKITLFVSPFILLFSGVVAYFPYRDYFERGWLINMGVAPRVPFLTGTAALIIGMILRQCSRRHGLLVEGSENVKTHGEE